MGQHGSCVSILFSGTLVASSIALHTLLTRILPVDVVFYAPAITWGFTCLCLQKAISHAYTLMLMAHFILASACYWKLGTSNAVLNRVLLYPLVGSVMALVSARYLPAVPSHGMAAVALLQGWSIVGWFLMAVVFPASIISSIEPQEVRGKRLENFMRQPDGRRVESLTVPSSNGVNLDVVVVQTEEETDRWIIYFGGNAEMIEDTVEEMSGLTEIVRGNWVFYNPRGVGRSSGYAAEVRDLVDDAVHVVRHVSSRYSIPPKKLLLWGHSIGGGIAAAVVRRECMESPLLLDRTFSSLSDAAVAFSPLYATLTRLLIRYTTGDLDVVADCKMAARNKKLVIYHRMDEVIAYDVASLGRKDVLRELRVKEGMVVELHGARVQSPHNSLLSAFEERMTLCRCVSELFR
ncbi:hypothetical protein TraAM80_00570 [Trypanosoma rangeli]|uniref:Serine aminopeptidase S33 domain-containing protein n=1 Tax=Trypanosoma rangeli TaxID=5698 RepID=A0A422P2Q7_TRYRA|nr:uncharacterized protein TraAM80_00570 [Trypanosoma rangeli]RNF12010.1 hypothetical protein TraAM80_00570 [Trypanosoma rangeli]|eukprot:RNF12010.1 hypothetical protein TraAM80_00570 [Trypanosoma rangeli]